MKKRFIQAMLLLLVALFAICGLTTTTAHADALDSIGACAGDPTNDSATINCGVWLLHQYAYEAGFVGPIPGVQYEPYGTMFQDLKLDLRDLCGAFDSQVWYCGGAAHIGAALLDQMMIDTGMTDPKSRQIAVLLTVFHEVRHGMQTYSGANLAIPSLTGSSSVYRCEQDADRYSGAMVRTLIEQGVFDPSAIDIGIQFYSGLAMMSGEEQTHGTIDQRRNAFMKGVTEGSQPVVICS